MSGEGLADALPSYEIGNELGRGAMGEVFAGRHKRLDRDVAIKQLPPGFARDELVRSRFGDEARVLASLVHPHIVPVYDYVEEDGVCLLVMEALPGGTVWDRFTSEGLSMPTACAVVLATCAGLAHAHEHRVLHRDIKPENLMFDAENTLKVTDFGIATVLGGDEAIATADGEIIGTPAYMAPEQAEGGTIGPEADVYAVGTMLYELLSGRLPFDETGDPMALLRLRLTAEPEPLDVVAPHVPEPLVAATMKAIARRPEDRFPGPEAFGVAVATAAATVWGADWRDRAQLRLLTAGPIADAAVVTAATGPSPVTDAPSAASPTSGEARGTVAPGAGTIDGHDGRETMAPGTEGSSAGTGRETVAPGSGDGSAAAAGSRETVAPGGDGADSVMTPAARADGGAGHHAAGPDLAAVAPEDMVRIADVLEPPPMPWRALALTVALAAAAALLALAGIGSPDRGGDGLRADQVAVAGVDLGSGDAVEVDLSEPIAVLVTDPPAATARAELNLSAMGVPLGTSADADVQTGPQGILTAISASSLRLGPSGPVTADLRLLDEQGAVLANREFALDPDRAGYASLAGIASILLALVVVAYASSVSAPLRRGRRQRLAYPKMVLVGALAGIAAALGAWSFAGTELTMATVVVCAALAAIAAGFAGHAISRMGRRRRLRRALSVA